MFGQIEKFLLYIVNMCIDAQVNTLINKNIKTLRFVPFHLFSSLRTFF